MKTIFNLSLILLLFLNCKPSNQATIQEIKKIKAVKEVKEVKEVLPDSVLFLENELNSLIEKKTIDEKKKKKLANILVAVNVTYLDTSGNLKKSFLIVHKEIASRIINIFDELVESGFIIEKIEPMSKYDWSDEKSMLANNTSSFNFRTVSGTRSMSKHAYGLALDINPFWNPFVSGKRISPKGAKYDTKRNGTIHRKAEVYKIFVKYGWKWGGEWKPYQDYQHFFFEKIAVKTF
jgi:hypothetical protein